MPYERITVEYREGYGPVEIERLLKPFTSWRVAAVIESECTIVLEREMTVEEEALARAMEHAVEPVR